jgi:hypothetical protein
MGAFVENPKVEREEEQHAGDETNPMPRSDVNDAKHDSRFGLRLKQLCL